MASWRCISVLHTTDTRILSAYNSSQGDNVVFVYDEQHLSCRRGAVNIPSEAKHLA